MSSGSHHFEEQPADLIRNQDQQFIANKGWAAHSKPIRIEEDVWIGCGSFIQQSVTIGRGAIIGAGSVVLKNVPPYAICVGAPIRHVRQRLNFAPRPELYADRMEDRPYFYRGFFQLAADTAESLRCNALYADASVVLALPFGTFSSLEIDYVHLLSTPLELSISVNGVLTSVTAERNDRKICIPLQNYPESSESVDDFGFVSVDIRCDDTAEVNQYCYAVQSIRLIDKTDE